MTSREVDPTGTLAKSAGWLAGERSELWAGRKAQPVNIQKTLKPDVMRDMESLLS